MVVNKILVHVLQVKNSPCKITAFAQQGMELALRHLQIAIPRQHLFDKHRKSMVSQNKKTTKEKRLQTNKPKQKNHMNVVLQNECEPSDFPSINQVSIKHLRRILLVVVIITKDRYRQWFCTVSLNSFFETWFPKYNFIFTQCTVSVFFTNTRKAEMP